MTDKFLMNAGATSSLSDGNSTIYGASLGAENLQASMPLKTDSLKRLISTKLNISDVTDLQDELDLLGNSWSRTAPLVFLKNAGDIVAVDDFQSVNGTDDIVFANTIDAQDNIKTDIIYESTDDTGVTIDSLLIKDGKAYQNNDTAPTTDAQLANKKYVDDQIAPENLFNRVITTISPVNTGDTLAVDHIVEQTLNNGVNIEDLNIKDCTIKCNNGDITLDSYNVSADSTLNIVNSSAYKCDCSIEGQLVVNNASFASPYTFSLQSNTVDNWMEILNSGGTDKGVFFGITGSGVTGDDFELWNYQGGSINFYTDTTASSGVKRMEITPAGNVQIAGLTASRLLYNDTTKAIKSVTLGGNLDLSAGGTLSIVASPSFTGTTLTGLTASRLVRSNAGKALASVGGVDIQSVIDDDTMATASDSSLATSESIKAYVNTQVGGASYWTRTTGPPAYLAPATAGDAIYCADFRTPDTNGYYNFHEYGIDGCVIRPIRNSFDDPCYITYMTSANEVYRCGCEPGTEDYHIFNETGALSETAFRINGTDNHININRNLVIGSDTYQPTPTPTLCVYGTTGDTTKTGNNTMYFTSEDTYPTFHMYNNAHDYIVMLWDCYQYSGGIKSCDVGSNMVWIKTGDRFAMRYATGVAQGSDLSQTEFLSADLTNGRLRALPTYNYSISTSPRDLQIDSLGNIGYYSSVLKDKANVEPLINIDFIYSLQPKTFRRRERDSETGKNTNVLDLELSYGFIAEEVEQVCPDLCFYDRYDLLKDEEIIPEGKETHPFNDRLVLKDNPTLAGVKMKDITALLVKCVQDQKEIIDSQQTQIKNLSNQIAHLQIRVGNLEGFHSI